jgi:DNA-binding response OmpR family regulator
MPTQKPRLLSVEDDELTRTALEKVLNDEGYAVCALSEGSQAHLVAEEFRPDLAILDANLGSGPDGFAVARRLREVADFPILFLTGRANVEDRLTGFTAGADDYLVKPFSMDELLARVHALLRRSGRVTSAATHIGDLFIDDKARLVTLRGQPLKLTPTEHALLSILARNPGHVFTKAELVKEMWGFETDNTHVVDVHVSGIRKKLEEHGARMIQTVHGVGYVLRHDK